LKPADKVFQKTALFGYQFFWHAVDWLYPPYCGGCGTFGSNWCPTCQAAAVRLSTSICRVCGDPLPRTGLCKDCCAGRPFFHSARSWAFFDGPVQNVLHHLKYRNNIGLGNSLAIHLAEVKIPFTHEIDLVVPVPLSRKRLSERGYNQAAMLAFPLALIMMKKYQPKALKKIIETKTQVGLNIAERNINMKNAFQAFSNFAAGKSILLVDDVMTTGATLNDCSRALIEAGAIEVNALTLARTRFKDKIN
jgi:competence protein ComFC